MYLDIIRLSGFVSYIRIYIYNIYLFIYTYPEGPKTKLCPLVGSGILYMNLPKDQPLCLVLDFQGIYIYMYMKLFSLKSRSSLC